MVHRRLVVFSAAIFIALSSRPAAADVVPDAMPLEAPYYDISPIYSRQDYGFPEGPMSMVGLRIVERGRGLMRLAVEMFIGMVGGAAEVTASTVGEYQGSSYSTDSRGNVWRHDTYRRRSKAELDEMRRGREEAMDVVWEVPFSMDLQLYASVGDDGAGLHVEVTPFTMSFDLAGTIGFEVGLSYTLLRDQGEEGAPGRRERRYENLGLPIRVTTNFSWIQASLQWTPNFFGSGGFKPESVVDDYRAAFKPGATGPVSYYTSPLSASVTLTPIKVLFVRGTGTLNAWAFSSRVLGWSLELGVRL